MAGKKDQAVVAVIGDVTSNQAANIQADILKSKNRHAPNSRGTIAVANKLDIGKTLSTGQKSIKKVGTKGD